MKITFLSILALIFISSICSQVFWDEIPTGISTQLSSVSNINGVSAWACGQNGTVIRTTNYGYNWMNVSGNGIPSTVILINIYGVNDSIAITAGYTGANTFVYRTTNRGINWTQVFTQANGFINAVWMTSMTNGFMQGDPVGSAMVIVENNKRRCNVGFKQDYICLKQAAKQDGIIPYGLHWQQDMVRDK